MYIDLGFDDSKFDFQVQQVHHKIMPHIHQDKISQPWTLIYQSHQNHCDNQSMFARKETQKI